MNGNIKRNLNILKVISKVEFHTDSFVCNKCGTRMILKVYGDTKPCNQAGCTGIMHRVI